MKKKSGKTDDTDDDLKKDDEEQSQRFIDKANEIEFDKSGKGFKRVLGNVKLDEEE